MPAHHNLEPKSQNNFGKKVKAGMLSAAIAIPGASLFAGCGETANNNPPFVDEDTNAVAMVSTLINNGKALRCAGTSLIIKDGHVRSVPWVNNSGPDTRMGGVDGSVAAGNVSSTNPYRIEAQSGADSISRVWYINSLPNGIFVYINKIALQRDNFHCTVPASANDRPGPLNIPH